METIYSYDEINARMREAGKLKNDSALSRVLDVTPQALSNYKRRGKMPSSLIIKFASMQGLSVDWLLTGKGGMYKTEEGKPYSMVMEKGEPYGKETREELMRTLEVTDLSPDELIYMGKLIRLFRKASKSTVTAIKCSIDAFLNAVESHGKNKQE